MLNITARTIAIAYLPKTAVCISTEYPIFFVRYEAIVMLILYIVYILLMFFNPRLGGWATRNVAEWQEKRKAAKDSKKVHAERESFLENQRDTCTDHGKFSGIGYGSVVSCQDRPERGLLGSSDSNQSQTRDATKAKLELSQHSTRCKHVCNFLLIWW